MRRRSKNKLRAARVRAGLTKDQLAAMAGSSAKSIEHYELGRKVLGPRLACRLELALGLAPGELIG